MTFFNRKEEVIDIELTQYGKLLLSKGKFKPKKYAFFDDDIVYDTQYSTPTDPTSVAGATAERQNGISTRIKESVRGKAQYNYGSAYNLGEIEEGEESFLMSAAVQNHVGFEEKIESIGMETKIAAVKEFKFTDWPFYPNGFGDWVSKVNYIVTKQKEEGLGLFKKTYTLSGYESQTTVETNFDVEKALKEYHKKALTGTPPEVKDPKYIITKYYQWPLSQKKYYPIFETQFESIEMGGTRRVFDHDIYYEGLPLGSMELKNQKMPAWDILSLNQKEINTRSLTMNLVAFTPGNKELDSFNTKYYTYGDLSIPQITADINVRAILDDKKTINLLEEDIVQTQQLIDGLKLRIKNDYLLLIIDEKNTYFENENFDIEVFEMENNEKPASATFIVSGVGSLSNGQTLKFTTYDGVLYSATIDTSVAKADSTANIIGTSDVTTNADLAESIAKSIQSFNQTQYTVSGGIVATFKQIGATSNYQFILDQTGFTEVYTKDHAVQGTLFTAGVLTSLVNWDEDPASKTLRRLYFSQSDAEKESGFLYVPEEEEISSKPVGENNVEYFMNIFVDEEIDSRLFAKYKDRLKNIRVDKLLKPDATPAPNRINIYGNDTEDPGSIC